MDKTIHYKIFVSSLLNPKGQSGEALRELYRRINEAIPKNNHIELVEVKNTSDIWMRDYMPIQIDKNTFVTYQYSPDYLWTSERQKYITRRFSTPVRIMANKEKEPMLPFYRPGVELRECSLILDGGNVVVCGDKVILTDKVCIENRPKSKDQIIDELKRAFGKEVIIIPSDPYEIEEARNTENPQHYNLPLCHADGVLAPIDEETILIADYGDDRLGYVKELEKVLTQYFKPENIKHLDFGNNWTEDSWIYINFLRVGNLVLMPALDDDSENNRILNNKAENQLKNLLGTDNIVRINTSVISFGKSYNHSSDNEDSFKVRNEEYYDNCGGALHCITWEVKM